MKASEGIQIGIQIGLLLGVLGFWIGILFGAILSEVSFSTLSITLNEYLPAIVTLIAAFLGAWYAFKLSSDKEAQKKRETDFLSGNATLFILIQMYNNLRHFQSGLIEPHRESPYRFVCIPTLAINKDETLVIDSNKLSFLLLKNPQILIDLKILESHYKTSLTSIDIRIEYHRNEAQLVLNEAGVINRTDLTADEIKTILGERLSRILDESTDYMIENVDKFLIDVQKLIVRLRAELSECFPNRPTIYIPQNTETNS